MQNIVEAFQDKNKNKFPFILRLVIDSSSALLLNLFRIFLNILRYTSKQDDLLCLQYLSEIGVSCRIRKFTYFFSHKCVFFFCKI